MSSLSSQLPSPLPSPTRERGLGSATLYYETWGQGSILTVLLHGFTGNLHAWDHLRSVFSPHLRAYAADLPGHGSSPSCNEEEGNAFERTLDALEALLEDLKLSQVHLVGYSLGARLALGLALRTPDRIRRLVLESGNAGLRRKKERTGRQQQDNRLAAEIEALGVQAFVDRWEALPLFRGLRRLPPELWIEVRSRRLACSAQGLASALRGLGLGAQPNYWSLLSTLQVPTLLIVGAEDEKFTKIAGEMAGKLPQGRVRILAECGHSPHLEQPAAYAREVLSFVEEQSVERRSLEGTLEGSL